MKLNIVTKNHPIAQADPFILEFNDEFYIFASAQAEEEGVACYKSSSLMGDYEFLGVVFSLEGHKEYWAPSVIQIGDTFYMYVSTMKKEEEDVHMQTMKVASAKHPAGPYTYLNDLIPPFSIDSHPVLNESGLFLFYSINDYEAEKAGTKIVLDRMISPTQMEGNPKDVVIPSIEEEIFMKNRFREGQDWHTIEGACYFREGDYHYLLYSANCYQNEYYFVGYSVCKSSETDLTKLEFKKYPNDYTYAPLLSKNEFEGGTGHNTVIKYNGEWYIVYHGRELEGNDVTYDNRNMRIGKLIVDGEKLTVVRDK
jgi:GH43 family beta-xylosidase